MSIGRLLTDSLSLYESKDDMPLLNEIVTLAKTVLARSKSVASVVHTLSFVEKVIDEHGASAFQNETIKNMIKDLILVSYEAIVSSGKAEGRDNIQVIATTMFKTLSACARRCPLLLLTLGRDGSEPGEVIYSCMKASPRTLTANEPEAILSTVSFLHLLFSALQSISPESLDGEQNQVIMSVIDYINKSARADVLISLVTSSCCGISPLDVVADFASLIQQILFHSKWQDVETSINAAFCTNKFLLGEEVRAVAIASFRSCTESSYPISTFADMITDMWQMHQTDDTGAIAGGESVLQFVTKFSRA